MSEDLLRTRPVVTLTIEVYPDGALAVRGPVEDVNWCLAALENAKDAVRNHHGPRALVVPGKDVTL